MVLNDNYRFDMSDTAVVLGIYWLGKIELCWQDILYKVIAGSVMYIEKMMTLG